MLNVAIEQGISVLVAQYNGVYREAMLSFMRGIMPISIIIPKNAVKNNDSLTQWCLRASSNIRLRPDAGTLLDSPRKWGPVIWRMLHFLAHEFTLEMKQKFIDVLVSLVVLLPCAECGANFKKLLRCSSGYISRNLNTRLDCERYIQFLHTSVNKLDRR